MELSKEIKDALIERVKNISGLAMQVRSDFDILSMKIRRQTDASISSTTLRRFFGYQEPEGNAGNSIGTTNIICQYAGFRNMEDFAYNIYNKVYGEDTSEFTISIRLLSSSELNRGDRIRIAWAPDRNMVVHYEGANEIFMVESCTNGKLMEGDTFHCHQFVQGEPLLCKFVIRKGMPPVDYICGRHGGIRFELLQ